MPVNLVTTPAQERLWEKAKQVCREAGLGERDGNEYWACVVARYRAMLKAQK